jgi:hypothetical protein
MMMILIGWDYVSELRPPTGILFIRRWYTTMENHGGIMKKIPDSSTRVIWYQAGGLGERTENLSLRSICGLVASEVFTCRKILRHGTSGFTSRPKEGVLRICIALKNPSSRPCVNPRTLGPMVSRLTITPSTRLHLSRTIYKVNTVFRLKALHCSRLGSRPRRINQIQLPVTRFRRVDAFSTGAWRRKFKFCGGLHCSPHNFCGKTCW